MSIKVRCNCGKLMKVRDSAAGKRVRCPDCANPVSVPEPDVDYDDYDDVADDGDGNDDYGAPLARRKPGRKAKKKKKSSGGVPTPVLIVGGILVGTLAIGGALYAVLGGSGGGDDVAGNDGVGSPENPAGGGSPESTAPVTNDGTGAGQEIPSSANSGSTQQPNSTGSGSTPAAAGRRDGVWVVLSDFKEQPNSRPISKTYQINYRVVAGTPDPSKEYVIYVGASRGSIMETYIEVPVDLQSSGTVHMPLAIGMSTGLRAYVGWKNGVKAWEPVSGEIKPGDGPTAAQRPPTVAEAAGAAAQGKQIALANARFEKGRVGRNALVVDYEILAPLTPGKRFMLVVQGNGSPVNVDVSREFRTAAAGDTDKLGVSLLPGSNFPEGALRIHIETRTSMIRRDGAETISNTATLRR